MARRIVSIFTAVCLLAILTALPAALSAGDDALPLPRFVSLKASDVNMRTGPGTRYPIDWIYQRRGLPVEITAEFDNWRRVRDSQGVVGWIYQSLLSGRRTALVAQSERIFRRAPNSGAPAAFRAAPGVVVEIISCDGVWCHVARRKTKAWTRQDGLWGVYPGEIIE
jgi:SH3-like domain-containing protein